MKEASTMANIPFKDDERITLRKAIDQAKESLAIICATLQSKGQELDTVISNIIPADEVTQLHAALPLMENGGRFIISSNPCHTLPDNYLNHIVQESGMGRSVVARYSTKQMSLLSQLKRVKDSVDDLQQRSIQLSEGIEFLSTPLNCLIKDRRPIMSLESQLSKKRRIMILGKRCPITY